MDTNNQVSATPDVQPAFSQRLQHSKSLIAIAAVLGVTVLALAAALVVNRSDAQPGATDARASTTQSNSSSKFASNTALGSDSKSESKNSNSNSKSDSNTSRNSNSNSNNKSESNNNSNSDSNRNTALKPAPAKPAIQQRPAVLAQAPVPALAPAPAPAPRAALCVDCGTVEAVTLVQRQGDVNGVAVGNTTIGLGTVAGGVVGGLLGNQVGGGSGKTAMTVLGAAGGALAGNQIEKNMKKVTVYQVRVRMNDGSTRTVEVSSSIPVGSRVIVEGNNLRMA